MRFMLLMIPKGYERAAPGAMPGAEAVAAMMKYNDALREAGVLLALDGLHPPSMGARVAFSGGGPIVTDGPNFEAKETLGGYWMIQVGSKREAVEWASRCPASDTEIIEVRQVQELSDFPAEVQAAAAGFPELQDILDFWFSPRIAEHWFASTPALDAEIRACYQGLWMRAACGELDGWSDTPEGVLALAIVLDQLPLNMYRGKPAAFSTEQQAVALAKQAVARGYDKQVARERLLFLYLPLMHSEHPDDQDLSVRLFREAGLDPHYPEHHRGIVRRFGRFPHRNAILGRESTPEELEYLASAEAFLG
jgi:uncharacterized protein (DUF924 family)